jgi:hypothetical protein
MGSLVRLIYSGIIQSVFRLDRVKSSYCDCQGKISVVSNSRWFTCFSSCSNWPKVVDFCPTLQLTWPWACAFKRYLIFTAPLCNNSLSPSTCELQFFSDSHLGASMRKGFYSWFRLGEVEPSLKDFLSSPAWMRFQVLRRFLRLGFLSIIHDVGCTKLFPSCQIFNSHTTLIF